MKFKPEEVSLCPHCYCVTHTMADGTCGKCKKKKGTDSKRNKTR